MDVVIRESTAGDRPALVACMVELQDSQCGIDPRLRPGASMAEGYLARIEARCAEAQGRIFVAERLGSIAGLVVVLSAQPFSELDEPIGTYALVTDLVVRSAYRGRGIGTQLLQRAEAFARSAGATEMRIGVLAANTSAERLYRAVGFVPHVEILTKRWPQ
jgi:GNAT superfamily N-acetyltransferase